MRTSCWLDDNSLHVKKSITRLKRLSSGSYESLIEEAIQIGAEEAIGLITNLHECEDGLYTAVIVNQHTDFETGIIEDWEYRLIPFEPEPSQKTTPVRQ